MTQGLGPPSTEQRLSHTKHLMCGHLMSINVGLFPSPRFAALRESSIHHKSWVHYLNTFPFLEVETPRKSPWTMDTLQVHHYDTKTQKVSL